MDAVPIKNLKAAEYNPRTISPHDFTALKRSITEFGIVVPVVVNRHKGRESIVIGGHQRLRAMTELGITATPVIWVDLPIEKEKALNLALNRITGSFNPDQLPDILNDIGVDLDVHVTGFTPKELDRILHGPLYGVPQTDEDPFSIEQALAGGPSETKQGEVVDLGPHRLACGDARDPELLAKLMGDTPARVLFTDPPYNIDYGGGRLGKILNDCKTPEDFQRMISGSMKNAFTHLMKGGSFYVCMNWSSYPVLIDALRPLGVHLANVIVWIKDNVTMGWQDYRYKHEVIATGKNQEADKSNTLLYGWTEGKHLFVPLRDEADVWYIRKRKSREYLHPTHKPVGLITRALHNSTRKGEIVLDPYAGSGSTLIAADTAGRVARLVELDPKYCDVIRKRYANYRATQDARAKRAEHHRRAKKT